MQWLRPYLVSYRLALSREFVYRTNFIFGRLRDLILFGGLIFLYNALPAGAGSYDGSELRTYVLLSTFVFAVLSSFGMNEMADEIFEGNLSNYLLRPINYYGYWFARVSARRSIMMIGGVLEVILLVLLVRGQQLFIQTDPLALLSFGVLLIGSVVVVQLLDFIAGTLAIWTGRAFGPRFVLYGILLPFLSGAFLPLDLLPDWAQAVLVWTPFPIMLFGPLQAYLGNIAGAQVLQMLILQAAWAIVLGVILTVMWVRGSKRYEAYGR